MGWERYNLLFLSISLCMNSFLKNISAGVVHNLSGSAKKTFRKVGYSWFRVKYIKHLASSKTQAVKFLNASIYVKNPREFLHGVQEIFIHEIYKQTLPANARILDCGAHIGLSILYIKRICPGATIIAFEPDSQNYDLLQKNINSYQLQDVTVEKKAVWNEDTVLTFAGGKDMGSHIVAGGNAAAETQEATSQQVQAVRLKSYLQQRVHFLKMDIEGAEYEVMKDIADQLDMVDNLFLEYHGMFSEGYKLNEMLEILRQRGFAYYIEEAVKVYQTPFYREGMRPGYDVQLNIFCFKA